nr:hypothetical protein DBT41_10960 [Aerococcus urinae]
MSCRPGATSHCHCRCRRHGRHCDEAIPGQWKASKVAPSPRDSIIFAASEYFSSSERPS